MTDKDINQEIKILINQFNAQNFEHVILKSKTLIKKNSQYVILYNLLGSAYQNTGNYLNAKIIFEEGLKLDRKNVALTNNLAMSYKNLLEYEKSKNLFEKIINENKNYINAYVNFGNLKRDLNQFDDALKLYNKALDIDKKNPIIYYSLALAFQGLGKFNDAINYAKRTLEIDPYFTRADNLISQSMKYSKNNDHYISITNKILDKNLPDKEKVELYFAITKAEEDMNNFKEASQNLILGNNLKKKLSNYNVKKDLDLLKNIKEIFNNYNPKSETKKKDDKIIFILGMPRSGTSLVEQIISSHSNVFGCGELPILSKIIKDNFIKNNLISVDSFDKVINEDKKINDLKINYQKFIKNFNVKEQFITDKAPLNFRWIGFIKILFPNSKIIHCKRDPKNNCLSIYKNLFEGGLNFAYDQEDLVRYYKEYENLMLFWKTKFKDSIFEIEYENLVNNNQDEIKKIINFCGLEWEDKCLAFHKNTNPIKTMSTAQARKPIYKTSLKSFEKYKEYLTFLENNL